MLIELLQTGEYTGQLQLSVGHIAEAYATQLYHTLHSMSTLMEPAMMLLVAIMMSILVVAMYLPIFQMGHLVH